MKYIKKLLGVNINQAERDRWLEATLTAIPDGLRILDAGAGELKNKPLCDHLNYVSQDICEYNGAGDYTGLQMGDWDTSKIDIVCDIADIPEPNASFDVILCSEVLEHVSDPLKVLNEFSRLLKTNGLLILTAPFSSLVHFAPYYYSTGFSRYWYEHHLLQRGFSIRELNPNGDWFSLLKQEVYRLPRIAKKDRHVFYPFAYILVGLIYLYSLINLNRKSSSEYACFGWHCVAIKK